MWAVARPDVDRSAAQCGRSLVDRSWTDLDPMWSGHGTGAVLVMNRCRLVAFVTHVPCSMWACIDVSIDFLIDTFLNICMDTVVLKDFSIEGTLLFLGFCFVLCKTSDIS